MCRLPHSKSAAPRAYVYICSCCYTLQILSCTLQPTHYISGISRQEILLIIRQIQIKRLRSSQSPITVCAYGEHSSSLIASDDDSSASRQYTFQSIDVVVMHVRRDQSPVSDIVL